MKCYRCQKELPTTGSNCPSCGQAVYTTHSGTGLSMGRRVDGCLPSAPSAKDFLATPNLYSLPRQIDLRSHCSPVEDQGQVGSCTACAAVGALEYQQRKAGKPAVDLSRMFVYFNARRMRGSEDRDSGAMTADAMAAFLAFGAPPEDAWPYDPNMLTKLPDATVYSQALQNVPVEYARVDGIENIKGALAQQYPVVWSTGPLPYRCYEEANRTGMIPMPTAEELAQLTGGGHSMLLVGYDLGAGQFIIRNSWGPDWGDKGYCRISFETFEAVATPQSAWILGKLDVSGVFKIVRPALAAKPVEGGVRDLAAKMRDEIRESLTKDIKDSFKDIKDRINPRRG